jgi:septal ring factor EnvC (AmiA/AmiB activator)
MITENVTTALQGLFLALTPTERWSAARSPLEGSFAIEEWLPTLAVVAQALSLIIVFWLIAKKRRLEKNRKQEIARLISLKEDLQQKIDTLETNNKALQQQISKLNQQIPVEASAQMSP